MSNSPLVSYTKLSPNTWGARNHKIDTITIHCVVGQCTIESLGGIFANKSRKASSNYGIGKDGKIGLFVPEDKASQCSSNKANDERAITIEVASDTTHPYAINDAAYNALVRLCADIAKRNGMGTLKWKADKSLIGQVDKQNMTVHRWFANKACPGDYIYERLGKIAAEANRINGSSTSTPTTAPAAPAKGQNGSTKGEFKVRVKIDNLNIRRGPATTYGKSPSHMKPGVYTIVEVQSGAGSKAGWGKLKSGVGWISLDYVERI